MCGWCLAYCTGVVLNTVRESAMPDSKENKQADAGSRRFRRHFCAACCCVFFYQQSMKVYLHMSNGNGQQNLLCPAFCHLESFVQQYYRDANSVILLCVCVVFSSHSFWTSSSLDVPAGVTQEEGHTGFLIHLSAVRALTFLARRIQSFLSLVDREVELCVLTI